MKIDWMRNLPYLFPAFFLWAVIQYAWDNYSPVPFWDTWDGFMITAKWWQEGIYTKVFSQHNGHRITLSKLLFLADFYVLKSHFSVLIATNVVLMLISFSLLVYLSRKRLERFDATCIGLVGCLVFLLTQAENIRWEFQAQFFLAQIIPLAAFTFFAKAMDDDVGIKNSNNFFVAMLFAILANFTMGNGFLASTIMLATLPFVRSSTAVKCSVAAVAAFSVVLMLFNRGATDNLALENFDVIAYAKYFLVYLGSPFYHVFRFYGLDQQQAGLLSSTLGLAFVFLIAGGCILFKKRRIGNKYALAALCMALYVILTACLTAVARYHYSIDQATSGRYTTPVLMGWAAIIILFWPLLKKRSGKGLKISAAACMLALLPYQQLVAREKIDEFYYQVPFSGDVLMVSLLLGVDDPDNMQRLHPSSDRIRQVIDERKEDAGFFTHSKRYMELQRRMTQTYDMDEPPAEQCRLHMDGIHNLDNGEYLHVQGWFKYDGYDGRRHFFIVHDGNHTKIGYGVAGQPRRDVSLHFSDSEVNVGFGGYFLQKSLLPGELLYFHDPETGYSCTHTVRDMEQ